MDIADYFEVPESKHAKSIGAQERAPAFVLVLLIRVLRTINFDSQFRFEAKNGPIEYCLRNWNPSSCLLRNFDHNFCSACVAFARSWRAVSRGSVGS